jgi:hypothetical protein
MNAMKAWFTHSASDVSKSVFRISWLAQIHSLDDGIIEYFFFRIRESIQMLHNLLWKETEKVVNKKMSALEEFFGIDVLFSIRNMKIVKLTNKCKGIKF